MSLLSLLALFLIIICVCITGNDGQKQRHGNQSPQNQGQQGRNQNKGNNRGQSVNGQRQGEGRGDSRSRKVDQGSAGKKPKKEKPKRGPGFKNFYQTEYEDSEGKPRNQDRVRRRRGKGKPKAPKDVDHPNYRRYMELKYGGDLTEDEVSKKEPVYMSRLQRIKEHNRKFEAGESNFTMGVNEFSDLTTEEFVAEMGGFFIDPERRANRRTKRQVQPRFYELGTFGTTCAYLDYRLFNGIDPYTNEIRPCLPPVRNQGECNSSWAYTAVDALASRWCLSNDGLFNPTEPFLRGEANYPSAQEIIDCNDFFAECGAEDAFFALDYIDFYNISRVQDYPDNEETMYFGEPGECADYGDYEKLYMPMENFGVYSGEANLYELMRGGPVIVSINIEILQSYLSGVVDDLYAPYNTIPKEPQAWMLLVGFDSDFWQYCNFFTGPRYFSIDYWIVRPTWGEDYGEDGYIRVARRKEVAGIGGEIIVPELKHRPVLFNTDCFSRPPVPVCNGIFGPLTVEYCRCA